MWSAVMVLEPPAVDNPAGFGQVQEQFLIEQIIAAIAVEVFDATVFSATARGKDSPGVAQRSIPSRPLGAQNCLATPQIDGRHQQHHHAELSSPAARQFAG
jgi:hypothetical protein